VPIFLLAFLGLTGSVAAVTCPIATVASGRDGQPTGTLSLVRTTPAAAGRSDVLPDAGGVPCDPQPDQVPTASDAAPAHGTVLAADALPKIGVVFPLDASGAKEASKRLSIDGVDVTSTATLSADGISYRPRTPLVEGDHTVDASITNAAGQISSWSWTFTTRSPPDVPDVAPFNTATTRLRPTIRAKYSDLGAGIDPARTRVTLNGADVTSQSTITDSGVVFSPATDLEAGTQTVSVTAVDRAGNATTRAWKFSVVRIPAPRMASGDRGLLPPPTSKVPK